MLTTRGLTVLFGLVAFTAACNLSSSPTSSAGSASSQTAAATPAPAATRPPATPAGPPPNGAGAASAEAAVQALLPNPAVGATICQPRSGPHYSGAAGCPVTQRLEQRLQTNPGSGSAGGADPICRCQNANIPPPVTVLSQTGPSATVQVAFGFPGHPNDVGFSVLSTGGRWYVDDTFCLTAAGGQPLPATSIYQTPLKACTT